MIKKWEGVLILFNLAYLIPFTLKFLNQKNFEFMLYVGLMFVFFFVVVGLQRKVNFSYPILWGLSIWGLLHMAGGGVRFSDGNVLYALQLIPIWVTENFYILKYDQFAHFFVYFIMVFVIYHLIKKLLKKKNGWGVYALVALASIGVSALNEIAEFMTVLIFVNTGVGGYYNTAWDLVFNTLGAGAGMLVLWFKQKYRV